MDWKEVGIGLMRMNEERSEERGGSRAGGSRGGRRLRRIVMRQQPDPTHCATRVILNVSFSLHTSIAKVADKAVRMTCVADGAPATFLFKFGRKEDANKFEATGLRLLTRTVEEGIDEAPPRCPRCRRWCPRPPPSRRQ